MCTGSLRRAISVGIAHSRVMDDLPRPPSLAAQALTSVAGSPLARVVVIMWWIGTSLLAALAYLASMSSDGVLAPAGGAAFLAGACVVAAVARNASAQAHVPGSVRRGSVLRAGWFGVTVHGGLLSAVTVMSESPLATASFVTGGAVLVVLLRPVTLVALGIEQDAAAPAGDSDGDQPGSGVPAGRSLPVGRVARAQRASGRAVAPRELSIPQIVGELHATAQEVRTSTDPSRVEALAIRRGALLDELAARDPQTLSALVEAPSTPGRTSEGPDGPVPA